MRSVTSVLISLSIILLVSAAVVARIYFSTPVPASTATSDCKIALELPDQPLKGTWGTLPKLGVLVNTSRVLFLNGADSLIIDRVPGGYYARDLHVYKGSVAFIGLDDGDAFDLVRYCGGGRYWVILKYEEGRHRFIFGS